MGDLVTSMESGVDARRVLAEGAAAAGLSADIVPFPAGQTLSARLSATPFLMAPMAGVSDPAYRIMARAGGAALAYTEMVSVAGIHYGGDKTWDLVIPDAAEPDIAVQLFGSDPEQFREATAAVCERLGDRLALIDVNMACPVPKVTRKGEGSALLDDPAGAARIIRACVSEADVPVTCKIRAGRVAERIVAPEFAKAMEAAGAQAIAVHGRTAAQLYRGTAEWEHVRSVAEAVRVPVIGSGDVLDARAAVRMVRETGARAAFVARGSYGNPWVFSDARTLLAAGEGSPGTIVPAHGVAERVAALSCHVRRLGVTHAHMARARSLAGWYLRGLPHASRWRDRAMRCVTVDDYLELAAAALVCAEAAEEKA